ncbi:hypothetical protein KM043_008829 [Ampulex compressa]|nr:hypothetical protein KM043_008829 [Ampulex compressa]
MSNRKDRRSSASNEDRSERIRSEEEETEPLTFERKVCVYRVPLKNLPFLNVRRGSEIHGDRGWTCSKMTKRSMDADVSSLEGVDIAIFEPEPEVVRSMERLYAVPSEKLRVWSVWLSKIGQVADEWREWLRSHIDLVVRIGRQLRVAEEAVARQKGPKLPAEARNVPKQRPDKFDEGSSESFTTAREEASVEGGLGKSAAPMVIREVPLGDSSSGPGQRVERTGKEAALSSEEETRRSDAVENAESPDDATRTKGALGDSPFERSTFERTSVTPAGRNLGWPIGIPWQPLGFAVEEGAREEEAAKRLDLPRDEREMELLTKTFRHQATIYRSYYEHWKETADRATREIAGRSVMATSRVRGLEREESAAKIDSTSGHTAPEFSASEEPAASSVPAEGMAEGLVEAPEKSEPGLAEAEPGTELDSEPLSGLANREAAELTEIKEQDSKPIGPEASIERDMARADEDVPYFFYVKAEPDVEIALEHDDEEVIAPDLDRESVFGNYRYLYFNLADKPGKGGKPWL